MGAIQTQETQAPLVLQVVICSTRPGRVGEKVARWFAVEAERSSSSFQVQLVDLKSFELPVFDEPGHPRLGDYVHAHTRRWAQSVRQADAFVFVMPEYNHFPPSSLVNAMTFLSKEWNYKAAGFVSYGGVSGGLRAVQAAKPLLGALRMAVSVEAVAIPNVAGQLNSEGQFVSNDALDAAAGSLLREVGRLAQSMLPLRTDRVAPSQP